jgi:dihydroflavonol-4-reductase
MNSNNFDKIALITGISGFVGSHLAQQLVAQGWQVRGLIRASSNLRWIQDLPITLYQCGLTNIESLEGPLQGVTHVFHIAGVVKANSLQQFEAGNVATTATLLQAISKYNKNIQHIVVTSSLAAAGPTVPNLPLIEAMAAKPVNWYGKSKWAQEQVCLNYTQQQQQQPPLPITIIRPPVVYGPRETDVLLFFKLIKRGILLQPTGNKQVLSLIYIDDLVNGLIAAAQSKNTINLHMARFSQNNSPNSTEKNNYYKFTSLFY